MASIGRLGTVLVLGRDGGSIVNNIHLLTQARNVNVGQIKQPPQSVTLSSCDEHRGNVDAFPCLGRVTSRQGTL